MLQATASPVSVQSTSDYKKRFLDLTSKADNLKSNLLYKVVKSGEKNHLAQRIGIEVVGVDLFTILCEYFLRGWKAAAGAGLRISLFVLNSAIIPTVIIPGLNSMARNKFGLPDGFKKLFYNQFHDLIPEKMNKQSNIDFLKKIEGLEGSKLVRAKFYNKDGQINHNAVLEFKEKLLKAKSFVMRWDIQIGGLLSYLVPWCQNWFEQGALNLIGFSGEDKFLDDSQKTESMGFHNRFKWIKFVFGFLPTIFGSHYYSQLVQATARANDESLKGKGFLSSVKRFIKKHIKQFDYHNGIFANKLNLVGIIFAGGDAGMILATRTIGEFFERLMRLSAFWPSFIYGIEWFHSKFAQQYDNKYGTQMIDFQEPAEFGIKKVKTLDKLEAEFNGAVQKGSEVEARKALIAMDNAQKAFGKAFFTNSALLGVVLNIITYIFMRVRIARGIY